MQELKTPKQVKIEENGTRFAIRSECKGVCVPYHNLDKISDEDR